MAAVVLTFWLLIVSTFGNFAFATTVINASVIPFEQQSYQLGNDNICRLLAHKSSVLDNDDHHSLIVDGGFGSFIFNWDGQDVEVADQNRYTVAIDLSSNFSTVGPFNFTLQQPKRLPRDGGAPVLSQFGMWFDSTQNAIYIQGGHFLANPPWNESAYYVPKQEIPENDLWRFDLSTKEWTNITEDISGDRNTVRTFGGAACSVPAINQSFWLGGIRDPYSSATSPANTSSAQNQFLVYDHSQNRMTSETYYTNSSDAFWHGTLDHLPVGPGNGFLISLMSQREPDGVEIADISTQNDERGQNVSFTGVMLYDLDKKVWYNQSTAVYTSEQPPYRTRFCSVVVHEEGSTSWELWVFGGQGLDPNQTTGSGDAWVLTMPAFIWTRILLAPANSNNDIRSHSCHAIGSQMLIVGGYPLGENVDPNTACDPEFIKVLDMPTATWRSQYSTGTTYKVHPSIAARTSSKPVLGGWADPAVEAVFSYIAPSQSKQLSPATIAGIVIGVLIVAAGFVGLVWWWCFRRRRTSQDELRNGTTDHVTTNPSGPPVTQPLLEPTEAGHAVREDVDLTQTRSAEMRADRPRAELSAGLG